MRKPKSIVKKLIIVVIICGIFLFSDWLLSDRNIIKGYYKAEEYFDPFPTQDSVDYCKYYYTKEFDSIFLNKYRKVTDENIEEIKKYFSNFKEWMDAGDRLDEYDFTEDIIDNNDFYLLSENPTGYKKFEYYTIHFYDTNNHVLYYVHANL